MARDTANAWEDIELRVETYHFCTSYQISSMNKRARSKNPSNPKAPFMWIFMDIIPETAQRFRIAFKLFMPNLNYKPLCHVENFYRKSDG